MQVVVSSLVDTVDLAREAARKRIPAFTTFWEHNIHAFAPNGVKKVEQSPHSLVGNEPTRRLRFSIGRVGGDAKPGGIMIALVFEAYGALCVFALAVFLAWASVAKLRPDLDEEEFDFAPLEKLKIEDPIVELSRSAPPRPVKQSKRPARVRPHLLHGRKPRLI